MNYSKDQLKEQIGQKLRLTFGCTEEQATDGDMLKACADSVCAYIAAAWQAVMATTLTMSSTEHPRERSLIGAAIPCITGPTASAPAKR